MIFAGCQQKQQWNGGAINKPGYYEFHSEINISVNERNNLIEYSVESKDGSLTIPRKSFSALHNWAFYLENDGTLWVFSSDMGHSVWKRNSQGIFKETAFDHYLSREEIPKHIYNSLADYFER